MCSILNRFRKLHSLHNKTVVPKYFSTFKAKTYAFEDTEKFDIKSLQNFKKILKLSGSNYKDGYTCLEMDCRICYNENTKLQNTKKAYINKTTGLFLCPNCNFSEQGVNVIKLYDNELQTDEKNKIQKRLKDSIKTNNQNFNASDLESLKILSIEEIQEYLKLIGINITKSIWQNLDIRYQSLTNSLHFPIRNNANLIVGEKILNLDKFEMDETNPKENCPGILLYKSSKASSKAVVVLKVIDFLALISQKIDGVNIICLPYWLKSLPQECLPNFEQFKELIFWFDIDNIGWGIARNFAQKLDEKRCYFIRPTDLQPTPYNALKKNLNLRIILQKSQPILHKSITTFEILKQDILSELQNIEKVNGVKWKRFPILNKLLKGHRKGELTILTGPTGCGKTTFISEYSLDLAIQGVSTLWGSFEIRNTRLASTLLRQYVGYPLNNKLNEFDYWTNEIQKFPIYFMTFHGQQNLKIVMEAIDHAQYVYDINHVIIDNVQFMMGMGSSFSSSSLSSSNAKYDKFWEQDAIIAAFRAFSTKRNVHVTLVMHPRKERDNEDLTTSSIFGSAKATQEADNVLIIQDKRLTSIRGKKYLQIAKNRYSGDLGIMPLDFDKDALSFSKKKKDN